jgi:hypothetical protein
MMKAAPFVGGAFSFSSFFLLTRSGGYEFSFAGARLTYARPAAEIKD